MQIKADLTRCAEEILLAREHYFSATIADMYDPDRGATPLEYRMDSEFPLVREAHETLSESLRDRNDEVLERIYIDRRFTGYVFRATPFCRWQRSANAERSRRENAWKNCLSYIPK